MKLIKPAGGHKQAIRGGLGNVKSQTEGREWGPPKETAEFLNLDNKNVTKPETDHSGGQFR